MVLWAAAAAVARYFYFFHRAFLGDAVHSGGWVAVAVYLLLGSVRGISLVPATYLVLAGIGFFPPTELWVLTLIGIAVSSARLYWFAETLGLGDAIERRHPAQLARLRAALQRHEFSVIVVWSFLPIAPTDVICYVCGALRLRFARFLTAVVIGEGAVCALYIYGIHFGAHWAAHWL